MTNKDAQTLTITVAEKVTLSIPSHAVTHTIPACINVTRNVSQIGTGVVTHKMISPNERSMVSEFTPLGAPGELYVCLLMLSHDSMQTVA